MAFLSDRNNSCLRKIRYASHIQAKLGAQYWAHKHNAPLRNVYECKWCLGWHLSKNEQKESV